MASSSGLSGGHQPVLVAEVVRWLNPAPGEHFIDATVGGGGHTWPLLEATAPNGRVLTLDLDRTAIARLEATLSAHPELAARVTVVHGNFKNLAAIARQCHFRPTGGCLFDLGLSSLQLDDPSRGFSFQAGSLDLRFDPAGGGPSGADLVNRLPVWELAKLFTTGGEEPLARPIAFAIAQRRQRAAFRQAGELADLVAAVYRRRFGPRSRRHPATRVFQALRIAVNQELENLSAGLDGALEVMPAGARIAVLSYHSLEDRMVKQFFRQEARGCRCLPDVLTCACGRTPTLSILTAKPIRPSAVELAANPRSRSARLRVAERR